MIFQIHPDHGKHIAYIPAEAAYNEKQGWRTVTEAEFYGKPVDEVALYVAKFGKKPHHKMKPETIKAALEE